MDTTVSDPLLGRLIEGRYRVEGRVAKGGMATVYTALDTRLDRIVALKIMHPAMAEDDEFVARFIREAKSAARLSHPNVVSVYDQGTDDTLVFLAMEYVEGRTLRDLLRESERLEPAKALAILAPVLAALAAAHDAGIVHRDVKPENVLIAADGRVKVADFGLARAMTSASHTATAGVLIGTVAYLAPEQVTRGIADARSDVYAAGILLYEMLTGLPPYDGETPISVAYRHVHEDVPAPSAAVPGLPASLDALVASATNRDPDLRPADAGALLAALAQVRRTVTDSSGAATAPADTPRTQETLVVPLTGAEAALAARPPAGGAGKTPSRPAQRRRRSRGWIALLIVLALTAGAAGAGWWYGAGRYTKAPGLLQLTTAAATAKAKQDGLKVHVLAQQTFSETVAAGRVVDATPKAGARVVKGSTITLTLSKGPERFEVPALEGKTLDEAEALLSQNSLIANPPTEAYDETIPEGSIVSTDPGAGTEQKRNTAINLVVSKGPAPIDVPNVTNLTLDKAETTLTKAGLTPSAAGEAYSDSVAKGSVVSQSPAGGQLARGATVTLVVSKGPELFKVPDVTSNLANPLSWLSVEQATQILKDAGFEVKVAGKGRFGIVTSQKPDGGSMQPHGTLVTIKAS